MGEYRQGGGDQPDHQSPEDAPRADAEALDLEGKIQVFQGGAEHLHQKAGEGNSPQAAQQGTQPAQPEAVFENDPGRFLRRQSQPSQLGQLRAIGQQAKAVGLVDQEDPHQSRHPAQCLEVEKQRRGQLQRGVRAFPNGAELVALGEGGP